MIHKLVIEDIVLYIAMSLGIVIYVNALFHSEDNKELKRHQTGRFRILLFVPLTGIFVIGFLHQVGFVDNFVSGFAIGVMGLVMLFTIWSKKRNVKVSQKA